MINLQMMFQDFAGSGISFDYLQLIKYNLSFWRRAGFNDGTITTGVYS